MNCKYCGISNIETKNFNKKLMLCEKHYAQYIRHGECGRSIYDKNEIIIKKDYAEVLLYDKRCDVVAKTIIDIDDIIIINNLKWHLKSHNNKQYAVSRIGNKNIYMHRLILNLTLDNLDVDHIDSNGLNNRKNNIRICTHQENQSNMKLSISNKSGVIGVFLKNDKWRVSIRNNKKTYNLGSFTNIEDAIKHRLMAEKLYCKNFAPQSYLFEKYGINNMTLDYIKNELEIKKIIGVYFSKKNKLWCGYLTVNNKKYTKAFKDELSAIRYRLQLEKELLKTNAPQVYLFEKYGI